LYGKMTCNLRHPMSLRNPFVVDARGGCLVHQLSSAKEPYKQWLFVWKNDLQLKASYESSPSLSG